MASVGLENLTDSEIRQKFVELGENIGPLTSTTRKVYLKKLKSLLDGNTSSVDLNSTKYDPKNISQSSGDESDGGSTRSRRRNMPPPSSNKSPPRRKSPARSSLANNALANSTFADNRHSEVEPIYSSQSSPVFSNIETKKPTRSSLGLNNSFKSQGSYEDGSELDGSFPRASLLTSSNKENYRVTSPDLGIGLSDTFRSRLQASTSGGTTTPHFTSPSRISSPTGSQPYVSDFVRKLSANKSGSGSSLNTSSPLSPAGKLLSSDVKESDDEDSGASRVYTRFTQGGGRSNIRGRSSVGGSRPSYSTEAGSAGTGWLPFDSPISAVLLLIFSLFFVFIGITYVNMHSADTGLTSPQDIFYPLCSTMTETNGTPRVNCIRDNDKEIVSKLFKIIYSELHERVKSTPCHQIGDGPFGMSDVDIQAAIVTKDPTMAHWMTQQQLPNVKILISANPKLKLIDISGGIALTQASLPFSCYLYNNLSWLALWLLKITLVVLGLTAVYSGGKYWLKREASHKEEVYRLANSVIELLSTRYSGSDSIVPIIHVRDQLIPPQDRQRLEKLWTEAVEVLNADSRVRCEQALVEGEDCLVWRWVAGNNSSSSGAFTPNRRKTWQGQAFDTMEGSVNSLPNSPTSCLKIRHMFDASLEEGDEWVGTVVDAILEKAGREARILHIAVERQSREGCVYMKCASPTDAGKAYRALHGSWFDSKLVTVKYIREPRYLERFPESAKCCQPLYPSNQGGNFN